MRKVVVAVVLAGCTEYVEPPVGDAGAAFGCAPGRACSPIPISGFPTTVSGDTRTAADDLVDA